MDSQHTRGKPWRGAGKEEGGRVMGYTLKIGEAKISYDDDGVRITCDLVRRNDAPAFGEVTDYENQRWPSYTAWGEAMRALGLKEVMFHDRHAEEYGFEWEGNYYGPLIQSHPGAAPITQGHVDCVRAKIDAYKLLHPGHFAAFPPPREGAKPLAPGFYRDEDYVDDPRYDTNLVRGEWLLYWLEWAVKNCAQPVFVNS